MELPTGTVTFLFTDVEGSTALLRRLKEGYAEVLAKHEQLLRDAAEAVGGQEFGTQGDAVFFVFRNPKDAVLAAVEGQRALEAAEWPEGVRLRVRMGVHTGEAAIAADRLDRLPEERLVLREYGREAVLQTAQQRRRAFDVGEEERDSAGRELHARRIQPY